jgi:hypothetical protein
VTPKFVAPFARFRVIVVLVFGAMVMLVSPAPTTDASQPPTAGLTRGFEDDVWFNAGWKPWVQKDVNSGAKVVSLEIDWAHVEP